METSNVRAVLFVKDLGKAAVFYVGALGMARVSGDDDHVILDSGGFELVLHRVPKQIADAIVITEPPIRRMWAATRLDFPVPSITQARALARYDPEGNQFGVSGGR